MFYHKRTLMNKEIASLEPQVLWQHFCTICEIPRPSGHLE